MKKIYAFVLICLCTIPFAQATTYFWVGPLNGKWSDAANWSLGIGPYPFPGGAGVPGPGDTAAIASVPGLSHLIDMDVSPTISRFSVPAAVTVKLVTSVNTTFTITGSCQIRSTITDSTTEDVRFNVVLNAAAADIRPTTVPLPISWIFSGRVPVSSGNGATVTLTAGAAMAIGNMASLVFRANSGEIASDPAANINFQAGSTYLLENNLNAFIPAATWSTVTAEGPAAVIQINGDAGNIRHSASNTYGSIGVNLPNLNTDIDLNLPDGTILRQNLTISNTNNHTLTLLSPTSNSSSVTVVVGDSQATNGSFAVMSGNTTITGNSRVALARAPASAPATSYRLNTRNFTQSGGNFSLQDADLYNGTSVLSVNRNFQETAGTFITNSSATGSSAKFVVEILGPYFTQATSGTSFATPIPFTVSSRSLDNATHMVTLRMAQVPFLYGNNQAFIVWSPLGITLQQPLQVGKLELSGGPVITSTANPLTVANPSPAAIQVTSPDSYVEGPLVRATNSTSPYTFPVGRTEYVTARPPTPAPFPFHIDSCAVIPASAALSSYQADYFRTRFTDTTVSSPFRGVDTSRYWNITRLSGSDAQVRLFLSSAVPQATSVDNLVVAHYVNGQWISEQGTVQTPGNVASGLVTSAVLSSFSPFTFGYGAFINTPLAIRMISFHGHDENGGARLNWKVAGQAYRFEVLHSADGITFSQVGTLQAFAAQQQYTYLDRLQAGNNFYRLRTVEKDGRSSLSDVIMVNSTGRITELMTLVPTVITSSGSLRINAMKDGQMQLVVTDMAGRRWKKLALLVRAGSSSNLISFSDLPAGTYHISGYMDGKQAATLRFVKQ